MIRIATFLLVMIGGLVGQPAEAQRAPAGRSADRVFQQLDADGDGQITREEIPESRQRMRDAFDYLDQDSNGSLSLTELETVLERAGRGASRQRSPRQAPATPQVEQKSTALTPADIADAKPVALPPPSHDVATRVVSLRDVSSGRQLLVQATFPEGPGTFPVILFSPYLGGLNPGYATLLDFLAGQGFVVLMLGHEESVSSSSRGMQEALGNWEERPRDFRLVLDNLDSVVQQAPELAGKLDTDAIGVSGHLMGAFASSFLVGAKTTDGETFKDERVKAALLMAGQGRGQVMGDESWRDVDEPMMVIVGSEHPSRRTGNTAAWRTEPFVFSQPPDKYLVYVQGMDGRFGGVFPGDGERYEGQVNDGLESYVLGASLDFWNAFLKGDRKAKAALDEEQLEIASRGIAEVSTKGTPTGGSEYAPLRSAFRGATDVTEVFDPERQRTIPLRIYAPETAPPVQGWPTVVFSHGLGESKDSYHYLGEALAANGYAVAFMSHEGSDSKSFSRSGFKGLDTVDNAQAKTADMHFVIDQLVNGRVDSDLLAGRVDASSIAAAGQCAGSSIASAMVGLKAVLPGNEPFASPDPRAKVVFLLGPQVPTELAQPRRAGSGKGLDMLKANSWEDIDVPMLVVAGGRDFMWFEGVKQDPRIRVVAYDSARSTEKYLVDLAGGGHHAFTDSQPWYPAGPRDPEHHEWITESVVAFLDAYLRNDQDALAWLQREQLDRLSGGQAHQEFVSERGPQLRAPAARTAEIRPEARPTETAPSSYYRDRRGPYSFEVVEKLVLEDRSRNKDLQVRVTYPVGDGAFPLIVFAHGAWASNANYQPLIEHWASHGYICLQANHADSQALGVTAKDQSVFRDWQERPKDVRFMLDSLDEIVRQVPAIAGSLDRTTIGVGGHSYGAHTAQLVGGTRIMDFATRQSVSFKDTRVDAVLMLSPQGRGNQLDEHAWDEVTAPLMTITGSNDVGRGRQGVEWRLDPFVLAASSDKYLLFINGAYHDFGGATGGRVSGARGVGGDNPDFVRYVLSASIAFWDAYLKDSAEAREFLRSGAVDSLSGGEAILTADPGDATGILAQAPRRARAGRR